MQYHFLHAEAPRRSNGIIMETPKATSLMCKFVRPPHGEHTELSVGHWVLLHLIRMSPRRIIPRIRTCPFHCWRHVCKHVWRQRTICDVKGGCGMLEGNDGGGGLRFRSTSRGRSFCWIPQHHPGVVVGCSGASLGIVLKRKQITTCCSGDKAWNSN